MQIILIFNISVIEAVCMKTGLLIAEPKEKFIKWNMVHRSLKMVQQELSVNKDHLWRERSRTL